MSYIFQIKYIGSNMIQSWCLVDNFIIHCVTGDWWWCPCTCTQVEPLSNGPHQHMKQPELEKNTLWQHNSLQKRAFYLCQQWLWWHTWTKRSWINDLNTIYSFDFLTCGIVKKSKKVTCSGTFCWCNTALGVVLNIPCVRLFVHLRICGIVQVLIVRLGCCMVLDSRMHGYLDLIWRIQCGVGPFGLRECGFAHL